MITKSKVEEIFEEYPSHLAQKIKRNYRDSYDYIDENFEGDTFAEKIYKYAYGTDKVVCNLDGCDNKCSFIRFGSGYNNYCSQDCNAKAKENKVENGCEMCGETFITVASRARDYCSEECRRKYFKTDECNKKRIESYKETIREKYGKDYYFQTDDFKEKAKKTNKKRYGDENYRNVEKAKKTKKERYGDPNYNNLEKMLETVNKKYNPAKGYEKINNISQTVEYKNRLKNNQIENIDKKIPAHIVRNFGKEGYQGVCDNDGSIYYSFKCKKCDELFRDFLNNGNIPVCPDCDQSYVGESEKEREVCDYIKAVLPDDINVIENGRDILGGKELDIYIPEKNIAIEFDGIYWHGEKFGDKNRFYHLNKTKKCEGEEIQLIHIFENEWVFKKNVVKSRLEHILGCSDKDSVYARNCKVKEINTGQKQKFLKKYHLKGPGKSGVKLGLINQDNLVSVMTFGTPSVSQGYKDKNFWEVKRFASSRPVLGGVGKLFKKFVDKYAPEKVITYADRRWSAKLHNVYDKIGFELVKETKPNYFYFSKERYPQIFHRFNFRKDVLNEKLDEFDPDLTEWENMQRNGYDRIWDCGHLKYEWG